MQTYVLGFCALGIAFGVASSVVDVSRFEREVRLLFTAVALATVAKAFGGIDLTALESLSLGSNPYSVEELSVVDYAEGEVVSQVEASIAAYLEEHGVVCEKVSATVNITDDGCISISRVVLSTDDYPEAKALIVQGFGDVTVDVG